MKIRGALFAALLAAAAAHKLRLFAFRVSREINSNEVNNHMQVLGHIGILNKNRAFGTDGNKKSLDYILNRTKRFRRSTRTTVQEFQTVFDTTHNITLVGPDGDGKRIRSIAYNVATPLPRGISAPLMDTPVDDKRGSACFEDQWLGINATNKIALVKRGRCPVVQKARLAKRHGALAVLVYSDMYGRIASDSLGIDSVGHMLPVGLIRLWDGKEWRQRLAAGENLVVTLTIDAVLEKRTATNVIVDTKLGDPKNVVMLGAKYDGGKNGPGINDGVSGTAALLEVMERLHPYVDYNNSVRFAWWGADERELAGSRYYASQLSEAEADSIRFYMDFNMLCSPYPKWTVFANNEVDEFAGDYLLEILHRQKRNATYGKFGDSSSAWPFIKLGIPSSGITTYAGEFDGALADPCHDKWCDDKKNVESFDVYRATRAAMYATARLALSVDGLPMRNKTVAALNAKATNMTAASPRGPGAGGWNATASAGWRRMASLRGRV